MSGAGADPWLEKRQSASGGGHRAVWSVQGNGVKYYSRGIFYINWFNELPDARAAEVEVTFEHRVLCFYF